MKDLKELVPGAYDKKTQRLSGILVKTASVLIVVAVTGGWFLDDVDGIDIGGYLMTICIPIAFVLLLANTIIIFRARD